MKWKSTKIFPPLHGAEDGYRESKRLLVFVSNAGKKGEIAFGRCRVYGSGDTRIYWSAGGYSRGFTISHWRDLPEPPEFQCPNPATALLVVDNGDCWYVCSDDCLNHARKNEITEELIPVALLGQTPSGFKIYVITSAKGGRDG